MLKLGLIINPWAGIGGVMGLKGSDGSEIRAQALAMGAVPQANNRVGQALHHLLPFVEHINFITVGRDMGADLLKDMGFHYQVLLEPAHSQTEADDTLAAARLMLEQQPDLLIFAGGDGTARNICQVVEQHLPVLGIPAGCKIHSGVYAVSPNGAGKLLADMASGTMVSLKSADVKDIDEQQFRQGRVVAKAYGEMQVPAVLEYVQATKMGGREVDELVLTDIAAQIIEDMDDELYIMGSGSTVGAVMAELGLENTLLGVDVIEHQQLIASDVSGPDLLTLCSERRCKLVITPIGGQGHIFGRGNQQLSPALLRHIGKDNIRIIASKTKLQQLDGRPLLVDTGDTELDRQLCGLMPVITGYRDQVLYPIASPGIDI